MDLEIANISEATKRNWSKLNPDRLDKLTSRANKSCSTKRVLPGNVKEIGRIKDFVDTLVLMNESVGNIIYSLCLQKISLSGSACNIQRFIGEYSSFKDLKISMPEELLYDGAADWIGYVYQSLLTEGDRNVRGVYYTDKNIVSRMMGQISLNSDETLFDPCCGSGAFLMGCNSSSLSQLYGIDMDPIAVMIAKVNLISKYKDDNSYPNIFCGDYLAGSDDKILSDIFIHKFDYICTNPPWGNMKNMNYSNDIVVSGEKSSLFLVKAFSQLKESGKLNFLLPSSLLKIKVHKDIRHFILTQANILSLTLYSEKFNGVFTDFFSIVIGKETSGCPHNYTVSCNGNIISATTAQVDSFCTIETKTFEDEEILRYVDQKCYDTLVNSKWALGIVTGDNKNKVKQEYFEGGEVLYIGKDINKYFLSEPAHYICYDRSNFQQCAKDEMYRSKEKLVYKFISKSLCFAYDDTGSLFLNSANILIPKIKGMSIKTVMAFLNSELFSFYYSRRFLDIKILKGNLEILPFPKITKAQNRKLELLVDDIIQRKSNNYSLVDEYVYSLYDMPENYIEHIKNVVDGTFRK